MKLTIIFLFMFLCPIVWAKTYYVTPTGGSDTNPGTITQPWATWQKAFDMAKAGDTVYFRGGVWYPTQRPKHDPDNSQEYGAIGFNGTHDNPICFYNYPGEKPILDCSKYTSKSTFDSGLQVYGTYLKLRGLTIRNCKEKVYNQEIAGIKFGDGGLGGGVLWLENITSHDHGGYGFLMEGFDTLYIKNCDSFNNCDSISDHPGNRADGFAGGSGGASTDTFKIAYIEGCRSWHNSDNAFDIAEGFQLQMSNCWAWSCGYLEEGAGGHFKFKGSAVRDVSKRIVKNCISAFSRGGGFLHTNLYYPDFGPVMSFYNNTSYKDAVGFRDSNECDDNPEWGWELSHETGRCVYRNNIAYQTRDNGSSVHGASFAAWCYQYPQHVTQDHNNWVQFGDNFSTRLNPEYVISDDDFMLVDSVLAIAQLSAPRKADGSLPDITFLKLRDGSDLIDSGINVGLPFSGLAPDLGYSEYLSGTITIPKPEYLNSVIENSSPSKIVMNFSLPVANIIPPVTAFVVTVNSNSRSVTSLSVSGSKVFLTLSSQVKYGDIVHLTYNQPSNNPLQTIEGGLAESIINQPVTNNCSLVPNQPPKVSIYSPTKSSTFIAPATVTIDAVASDPDGTISKVEFFQNSIKIGERTNLPYSFVWKDVPEGSYSISVTATDNDNSKTSSASTTIIVEKSSSVINQLPIVSLSSISMGRKNTNHDNILIEVFASDPDGIISKVELKNGLTTLVEFVSEPYIYHWNDIDTGMYFITAVATDNKGAVAISPVWELRVDSFNDIQTINLYPNPNNGHFTIKELSSLTNQSGKITVLRLSGEVVHEELFVENEISKDFDLSHLACGSYILMVTDGKNIIATNKFIIR